MEFTKMHGLGNDFVVLDCRHRPFTWTPAQIRARADRHRGIGFDQLLIIEAARDPSHDFVYRIFNADGGEVEHCGNGARCFGHYLYEQQLFDFSRPARVQVKRGLIHIDRAGVNAQGEALYAVDMGTPHFAPPVLIDGERFFRVDMGNPHAVRLVADVATAPVAEWGPRVQRQSDLFPEGVNVGFMARRSPAAIDLRVYERGAGETQACGTGACAAVAAGIEAGLLGPEVVVNLPGGTLQIRWQAPSPLQLIGPAATVFRGSLCYT